MVGAGATGGRSSNRRAGDHGFTHHGAHLALRADGIDGVGHCDTANGVLHIGNPVRKRRTNVKAVDRHLIGKQSGDRTDRNGGTLHQGRVGRLISRARFVHRLNRQFTHALQHAGDLIGRALRRLDHRDGVPGVAYRLVQRLDLLRHARAHGDADRIVTGRSDALARGQLRHRRRQGVVIEFERVLGAQGFDIGIDSRHKRLLDCANLSGAGDCRLLLHTAHKAKAMPYFFYLSFR